MYTKKRNSLKLSKVSAELLSKCLKIDGHKLAGEKSHPPTCENLLAKTMQVRIESNPY